MAVIVFDNIPQSAKHGPQPEGFEHHGRLTTAVQAVTASLATRSFPAPVVSEEALTFVHTQRYLDELRESVRRSDPSKGTPFGEEVLLYPGTLDAALTSAGAAVRGVKLLASGQASAVISLCRSPGHHAEPEKAMGFCVLSNAAIAACFASRLGMQVAVVDIDIHNGNGTFAGIKNDERCFFAELYLAGDTEKSYPYPGRCTVYERTDRGHRIGLGSGTSGSQWVQAFCDALIPSVRNFSPDLLIISAGFDCMSGDPVGGFGVVAEDIATVTRELVRAVPKPVLSLLEGGYNLDNLAAGVAAHAQALPK